MFSLFFFFRCSFFVYFFVSFVRKFFSFYVFFCAPLEFTFFLFIFRCFFPLCFVYFLVCFLVYVSVCFSVYFRPFCVSIFRLLTKCRVLRACPMHVLYSLWMTSSGACSGALCFVHCVRSFFSLWFIFVFTYFFVYFSTFLCVFLTLFSRPYWCHAVVRVIQPVDEMLGRVRRSRAAKKRWIECSVLVIDEISMMEADLFDKLNLVGQR